MHIIISSKPESLSAALAEYEGPTGTVEAEYGDICVEGSAFTLAHHGSRSHNPPPCITPAGSLPVVGLIGLSHFDLDALMGVGVAMGRSYPRSFAALAAHVDVNGPHHAQEHEGWVTCPTERGAFTWGQALQAFWAWSEDHRYFPPRDGSVADATEFIEDALDVLDRVLAGDEELLAYGAEWAEGKESLNRDSLIEIVVPGGILLRQSPEFCNHMYNDPDGRLHACVVTHNPEKGSVTLSFENADAFSNDDFFVDEYDRTKYPNKLEALRELAVKRVHAPAKAMVQRLWGEKAGGHPGIAGSPYERHMTLDDARELVALLKPYF